MNEARQRSLDAVNSQIDTLREFDSQLYQKSQNNERQLERFQKMIVSLEQANKEYAKELTQYKRDLIDA